MTQTIINRFRELCQKPSDINEHLQTLNKYAAECKHITEMGVRNVVSTWAFLAANPKRLICYDIHKSSGVYAAIQAAKEAEINMEFYEKDVLKVEIEPTELLFIDTLHTYTQLKKELEYHSAKVSKYIIFHDVVTYGYLPEPSTWQSPQIMENYVANDKGIIPAIQEFLNTNTNWKPKELFENNNGLLIIEKIND